MSLSLKKIEEKIAKLEKELEETTKQRNEHLGQTAVICSKKSCGKGFEIKDLTFLYPIYYVPPSGCTGGDYWSSDDNDGYWVCPSCNTRNRLYRRPEILELRHLFKKRLSIDDKGNIGKK